MRSKSVRTFFRPVCSTIFMVATLFSNTSNATTWEEQGDAGDLINSAQSILGIGAVDIITGRISARSDVDLYKINISDPSLFSAVVSGGGNIAGDTDWDSKLWLFDENGLGIFANDDAANRNEADAGLPSGHALGPQVAGKYFLAISDDDISPISGSTLSDLIFEEARSPWTHILAPTGDGGNSPLTEWRPANSTVIDYDNVNYSITLNGAELTQPPEVEDQIAFIERFYQNILGRASDSEGLQNWVNILQTESGTKVAFGFFNSPEFNNLNLENPEFVDILYRTMFDRDPDEEGLEDWMSSLDAGGLREMVIYGFLRSQEFKNLADSFFVTSFSDADNTLFQIKSFVQRFYQLVLNREPEKAGFDDWSSQLVGGSRTGGDIARGFFLSLEFENRMATDSEFIDIAYQAFFDREADAVGKQNWLEEISFGMTREEIVNGFIGSQEFIILANSFGIRAN